MDYTIDSAYDALGRTTGITYPDPGHEIVNYTYNTGGNLQGVVGYATFSNYNALGQAGLVAYGNGDNTVYQFNAWNNRLYSLTANSQTQGGLQNLAYAYDNVGNIQTITDLMDNSRTQSFQYDDLNRITQAQSTAYGTLTYSIDAIGNMTYNSQVGGYTYLPAKPHAVVTAGGNSYTYDPNGNMMGRNGATLTHDYENRLSSLVSGGTTTTFVYDAAGGRVKKTSSSITTLYIDKLYECTSGVCTKHIFAGGNRIVSKKPSGTYYYHTDHLRSSSVITNDNGAMVEEIHYYPFGQTRVDSGSVNLHYKYTGQEEDAETGLYFYNARYYDPAIGRFVSADTIVSDPSNPQSLNRYAYVLNNPLRYTDPTGHYDYEMTFTNNNGGNSGGGEGYSTEIDFSGVGPALEKAGHQTVEFFKKAGSQTGQFFSKAGSQTGDFLRDLGSSISRLFGGGGHSASGSRGSSGRGASVSSGASVASYGGSSSGGQGSYNLILVTMQGARTTPPNVLPPGVGGPNGSVGGENPRGGSAGAYESHWLLRTFVPGQIYWDQALTAFGQGDYLGAGINTVGMVGEQAFTALTVGQYNQISTGMSKIVNNIESNWFRYHRKGRWKTAGQWRSGRHFHLDPFPGSDRLMKYHLPDQYESWWGHFKSIMKER